MLQGAYPGMRLFFVRKCMQIRKSYYFDSFRCVASACPDSCCKEWDVQVDGESAAYYRSLTGPLGDRLRAVLKEDNDETVMTIENGRCPMWRADGLCQIQAELGEAALCKTCREFPRLTHDYGDYVERGLELSCPEAAKLILQAEPMPMVTEYAGGKEAAEYDVEAMAVLRNTREQVLDLLSEETYTIGDRLALVLLYGCLTGASFYSEGIFGHRNVIYNSVPVYMADKMDTVCGFFHHFIFSDETREQCERVISAYKKGLTTDKKIKRLK